MAGYPPSDWRYLDNDGINLACADYGGDGTPLLILHGLCGHAEEWREVAAWLSSSHRVVVPDARGHGRSERYPASVSRDSHVADAACWLEDLDIAPAIVIGQSLGGHTAFLLAARRPDLVKALVVVEATPDAGPKAPASIREWLESWPVPFALRKSALEFFGRDRRWAEAWVDGLEETADGLRPRFDTEVMVASLAEMAINSYWDEWQSTQCPTLIVRGETGVPRETCDRMAELLPDATVAEVSGVGHDPHLEDFDAFRAALLPFVEAASARP